MSVSHISSITSLSGQASSTSSKFLANTPVICSAILPTSLYLGIRGIATIVGPTTFSPTAANLLTMDFVYSTAADIAFALPSVASVAAYIVTQRIPYLFNASFELRILNASANVITVTNGGDSNWTIASTTTGTNTILAHTSTTLVGYLSGSTTGIIGNYNA